MKHLFGLATVVLGASMLTGCFEKRVGPEIVNVEGTITVDGQPMEGLRIEFWPQVVGEGTAGKVGHNSAARTDANGHFVMEAADASGVMGAVVGSHKIAILDLATVPEFLGRAAENHSWGIPPRISIKYFNTITSELSATIDGPRTDISFDLRPYDPQEGLRMAEAQRVAEAAADTAASDEDEAASE
mgnify:CR=1 FL=1